MRIFTDFPAEIWLLIVSFLPSERHIRKLLGLNRFLFETVMNDIYRDMKFYPRDDSLLNVERLTQIQYFHFFLIQSAFMM